MSKFSYIYSCLLALLVFTSFVIGRQLWVNPNDSHQEEGNYLSLQFSKKSFKNEEINKPIIQEKIIVEKPKKIKKAPKRRVEELGKKESDGRGMFADRKLVHVEKPRKVIYQVRAGDRLDLISKRFYGSHQKYHQILEVNPHVDPRALRPGTKLIIPNAKKPKKNHTYYDYSQVPKRKYVFRSGDVLGKVAQRELGTVKMLPVILELNPGLNPRKIRAGQEIYLPVKKKKERSRAL